ncbi:hypothetical protein BH18ACT4_BH18ACT4_10230 [soil metagenome]
MSEKTERASDAAKSATGGDDEEDPGPVAGWSDRGLEFAENIVYSAAGLMLVAAAIAVLGATAYRLVVDLDQGTEKSITAALDGLLLVFILLELLAGIRATIVEHKLVAEPFLIVGVIASIKEIVVATLEASTLKGAPNDEFTDAMTEIGVLGGLVLVLALANWLLRRKEREPEEEDEDDKPRRPKIEAGSEDAAHT